MTHEQLAMNSIKILTSLKIPTSTTRVEILKAILAYEHQDFTIADIEQKIKKGKVFIGFSSILAAIVLFKTRGIVVKTTNESMKQYGKHGRPVTKLRLSKGTLDIINS